MSYDPDLGGPQPYWLDPYRRSELREALNANYGIFPPDPVIDARLYPHGEPLSSRCRRAVQAVLPSRAWVTGVCGAVIATVIGGLTVAWLLAASR